MLSNYFPFVDSFGQSIFKLIDFGRIFLFLQKLDHERNQIMWILVDDLDHHSTENGINMRIYVLKILDILKMLRHLDWFQKVLELKCIRK